MFSRLLNLIKFSLIKNRRNILFKNKNCIFKLNPKFEIDQQILKDNYEKKITLIIETIVAENFYCIDAGANFGYYSILMSKLVGENGKIFAFEPSKYQYERLKKNMNLNDCKNLHLYNYALSDKCISDAKFYEFREFSNREGHSTLEKEILIQLKNNNYNETVVEQVTIDDFIQKKGLEKLDFIKIDIEGTEFKCLKGSQKTIDKFKPIIIFELGRERNKILKNKLSDLKYILKEYCFYGISNGKIEDKLTKIDIERDSIDSLTNITDVLAF